jgi:hypothetical protein
MSDDLLDLLTDNSNKVPKKEKSSFLTSMKNSSAVGDNNRSDSPYSIPMNTYSNHVEPINEKKGIEIDEDVNTFGREGRGYSTGTDFYNSNSNTGLGGSMEPLWVDILFNF